MSDEQFRQLMVAIKEMDEGIRNELNEIKSDISVLKNDVCELKKDVSELKKDVGELKRDMGELKSDMKEVKERVARLEKGQEFYKEKWIAHEEEIFHLKRAAR